MGKQSPKALKPAEIEGFARQQNYMNNPNQSNYFGSTTTTFDANDQASINQQLSPRMEGIVDNGLSFVEQGPQQIGQFSMPFLEGIMQNTANSLSRTGGWGAPPQVGGGGMGGFQNQSPDPGLSFGMGAQPPEQPQQQAPQPNQHAQALGQALSQIGNGGGMGANVAPTQLGVKLGDIMQNVYRG